MVAHSTYKLEKQGSEAATQPAAIWRPQMEAARISGPRGVEVLECAALNPTAGRAETKGVLTVAGSKTNAMSRKDVLAAVRAVPPGQDFVWDGKTEDDHPASTAELAAAALQRRGRGRPAGSGTKQPVAIRLERDVLSALRASGPGWQTRLSDAVGEWVKSGRR